MIRNNPAASLWAAIAGVAILFLGVVAVAGVRQPLAETAVLVASGAPTLEVELSEFAIAPGELQVEPATPTTVVVANVGQAEHDLTLVDGPTTGSIAPGDEGRLELPALEEGSYELVCSLAGHADAGMKASLTVGAAVATSDGHGVHRQNMPMAPEEMARMHEQGVADFPVETEGVGGRALAPTIAPDGTKVFEITASEIGWETEPGKVVTAWAYNEMVPGPQIDVDLGDRVRVVLRNELPQPTALHFHGLLVPNDMDGVPGLNQPSVMPGEQFTYEFEVRNAGSHMYHSHFDSAKQVPMGLLGAFVVHAPEDPAVDVDLTMVLNDGPLGYTLNGKGFPATAPVVVPRGAKVRVRYMNEGLQIHPMHLHGIAQQVIARDGYPLPQPYTADTITVAPGERIDVLVDASEPGAWAWHCHVLNHAEGEDGMFGMVTAMVVQ